MNQFNNIDLQEKHDKPFIKNIKIIIEPEQDPQLDYLQQEYNDVSAKLNQKYKQQDKERLENYGVTWESVGIYAKTTIYIPLSLLGYSGGNIESSYQMINIKSGGIWGIERDFNGDNDIEKSEIDGQIEELKTILKLLNIEVPDNIEIVKEDN